MKILDLTPDELFNVYNDFILDPDTDSIRDNAKAIAENESGEEGVDYLYNDFMLWLQKRENFTDDEVSIFITVHGDYIYGNIITLLI